MKLQSIYFVFLLGFSIAVNNNLNKSQPELEIRVQEKGPLRTNSERSIRKGDDAEQKEYYYYDEEKEDYVRLADEEVEDPDEESNGKSNPRPRPRPRPRPSPKPESEEYYYDEQQEDEDDDHHMVEDADGEPGPKPKPKPRPRPRPKPNADAKEDTEPEPEPEPIPRPKKKPDVTLRPSKTPKQKPVPPGEPPGQGCEDKEDLNEILESEMFIPCPTLGRAYHGYHGDRWPLIASSSCGGKDKMMATACFLNGTFKRAIWGQRDTEVAKCMIDLHRDTPFKCITVKGSKCNFDNYAERGGLIDYAEKEGPYYRKLDMYKFTELEADAIKNVIDHLEGLKIDAKQRANPQFWVWFMDLRDKQPSEKHVSFSLYYDKHNGCG